MVRRFGACRQRTLYNRWTPQSAAIDRVMLMPDGGAVVIDYKFGSSASHSKYRRQVRDYVFRLKSTRRFSYVKGYIWYVAEDKTVDCDSEEKP